MTDGEKLWGWIQEAADEGMQASLRWVQSVDKMAGGTYEPKDAVSDWYYFASRWLAFVPDPSATPRQRWVVLSVRAGEDSAVGTQRIPRASAAKIPADLVNTRDPNKKIPLANLTAALHDGGLTLLVSASGLKALNLSGGATYVGEVTDGGKRDREHQALRVVDAKRSA